jgi:hypothetical protein
MNIYEGLDIKSGSEIDDFLAGISADVINQYIMEDGIIKEDREDRRVEMMMRFSEGFFIKFLAVIEIEKTGGRDAVVQWIQERMPAFNDHAKRFQPLYQQVAHLADPPHFVTSWAMCYLVAESLDAHKISQSVELDSLSSETLESVEYILRFGENLLMEFQSRILK